jgi:two-component system, OmpR family, response regulator MprA
LDKSTRARGKQEDCVDFKETVQWYQWLEKWVNDESTNYRSFWGRRETIVIHKEGYMTARILVIEDEDRIRQFLQRGLAYEGYRVDTAVDGRTGLDIARDNPPDLVLLDIMLPGMDGLEVCRRLRAVGDVPILMLTAKESIEDRVAGLDAGADDYLVKPFAFDELLARVRALLRRAQPAQPQVYRFGDLELDTGTRQGRRAGRTFDLTAKEYELLELFLRNPRQVLTRDVIFDRVWGYDFGGESNIIEVYVRYLRQKTEIGELPRLIHTVRGVGYVLREEE